jgi:hypothetical protein
MKALLLTKEHSIKRSRKDIYPRQGKAGKPFKLKRYNLLPFKCDHGQVNNQRVNDNAEDQSKEPNLYYIDIDFFS